MYPSISRAQNNAGDGEPHSQQTTPPLVFTTQLTGTPHMHDNSPSLEALQVANYNTVLGGGNDFHLSSPVIPRRHSSTQLHVEDSPIRVTCRTRDGRKSPVLAQPMPNDASPSADASLSNPYRHFSGRSSPIQASSPVGGKLVSPSFPSGQRDQGFQATAQANAAFHQQQSAFDSALDAGVYPSAFHSGTPQPGSPLQALPELPATVVHRALHGRCRFVEFPTNLPPTETTNSAGGGGGKGRHAVGGNASSGLESQSQIGLFIGQVRFETTPAELIWLVHRTSGACASHLESRGAGCYLLFCKSEADLPLVRGLHKRVLFDIGGVWLARTAEEVDALCEYVALDAPLLSRKAHLPRDSMVVEELKLDAPPHHAPGGRFGQMHAGAGGNAAPPPPPPQYGFHSGGVGVGSPPAPQQQPTFPPMYPAPAPPYSAGNGMFGPPIYEASAAGIGASAMPRDGTTPPPPPPPYQ